MNIQNPIKRALGHPPAIETIQSILSGQEVANRIQLADRLCDQYKLHGPRGQRQRSGCLRALRELERAGHFELPATHKVGARKPTPRRLPAAVEAPTGVPRQALDVEGLSLVEVETEADRRIWNELMIRQRPRGAGPLVGGLTADPTPGI